MNKSTILSLALLAIIICPVTATLAKALNGSNTRIFTYGSIRMPTEDFKIGKKILPWGNFNPTEEQIQFIATHFDVVNVDYRASKTALTRIKQLNPSIAILMYLDIMGVSSTSESFDWNVVNSNEAWFIHDLNGNRVQHAGYGWYCMDVGNQGWRNYFVQRAMQIMAETPAIDGIFADDVWSSFPSGSYPDEWWNPWTVSNSLIAQSVGNRWHNDMLGLLSFIKSSISNKLLIINSGNNGDYVDVCDGKWEEDFVHPRWDNYGNFLSVSEWKNKIDGVKNICQRGKIEYVSGGCSELESDSTWTQTHSTEIRKLLEFCFFSYLLGASGTKSAFNFGVYWNRDGSRGYYSIFDDARQLGSPTNDYYYSAPVYARDFDNGKVLVNPETSSYTIFLGQNYRTLDGQTISSVTLNGHTGVILLTA